MNLVRYRARKGPGKRIWVSPPTKKARPERPPKYVIKLVADIENVHIFSKEHGVFIFKNVKRLLFKVTNPDIKFELQICMPKQ